MKNMHYELPFRWNISQRETLGTLLEGQPEVFPEGAPSYPADFRSEITASCARIIAFSENADLYVVGRSLETLFDYLSGLLIQTSWAERFHLLQFSWYGDPEILPGELAGLRSYFEHIGLAPYQLTHRKRPVAFVDLVASGGTFGNLITFLSLWSRDSGEDWGAVEGAVRTPGAGSSTSRGDTCCCHRPSKISRFMKESGPILAIGNAKPPDPIRIRVGGAVRQHAPSTMRNTSWRSG